MKDAMKTPTVRVYDEDQRLENAARCLLCWFHFSLWLLFGVALPLLLVVFYVGVFQEYGQAVTRLCAFSIFVVWCASIFHGNFTISAVFCAVLRCFVM